jgi:hypothetical protein
MGAPLHSGIASELKEVDCGATATGLRVEDQAAEHFATLAKLDMNG